MSEWRVVSPGPQSGSISAVGSWQKGYVLTKSKRNKLQEACQCDQKGFQWKLQRKKAKSPSTFIKAGQLQHKISASSEEQKKLLLLTQAKGKRMHWVLQRCSWNPLESRVLSWRSRLRPTRVLGLSGASMGNERAAASDAAALSSSGECSGQGTKCCEQQSVYLSMSVQGHKGNGNGFPFHGDCTMMEACHKRT